MDSVQIVVVCVCNESIIILSETIYITITFGSIHIGTDEINALLERDTHARYQG